MKFKDVFKKLAAPVVAVSVGPLLGYKVHQAQKAHENRKQGGPQQAGPSQYDQQQAEIARQASLVEEQRRRISSEREISTRRIKEGMMRSNRRRVRGGLFGDTQVDQNISQRLG